MVGIIVRMRTCNVRIRTRVVLPFLQASGAVVVPAQEPDGPRHQGALDARDCEALNLATVATPD